MSWLIELLFEAVRELCSQFIIDMMDVSSGMFTEILSCDLNLFEELFGVVGDLYRNAVLPIAIMLILMILVWQLFKSMFGKLGTNSEDPLELVFRSGFCLFMAMYAKSIVNYILELVGTPYSWVVGTDITVTSFSEFITAADAVTAALGVDSISIQLLLLVMHFVVAWNYFKLLFILAERYVLLGVFSYTAPLAFATGGAKATNNILASWTKMFGGQVLIVILDAWCLKMFLSGYGNLMASGYGFTKFFAATMCLIGFCKIAGKLDSYMGTLGVNLGRTSGGMSGLAAAMMAGRLLHAGGGSRGGTGKSGAGQMNFGGGKSIPLGAGSPDFGAAAMNGVGMNVSGGAGMGASDFGNQEDTGMDFGGRPEANLAADAMMETENGQMGNGVGPFEPGDEPMDGQNMPFGIPDDEVDDFASDGMTSGIETDTAMSTEGMDLEGGEIPYMESAGGYDAGPFGIATDEVESVGGMEDFSEGSMDMSEISGISELQSDTAGAIEAEDLDSGSYGADAGIFAEGLAGAGQISGYSAAGDTESGVSAAALAGAGTAVSGSVGSAEHPTGERTGSMGATAGGHEPGASVFGEAASISGASGETASAETAGYAENASGAVSGAYTGAGQQTGPDAGNVNAGSMDAGNTMESMDAFGNSLPGMAGAYPAERDGERYMRYDAGQYEKPQGAYQTIHENGKTYYELPEKDKAPGTLPETKAILEKNGSVRLEKYYREPQQARAEKPVTAPEKSGDRIPKTRTEKKSEPKKSGRKFFGRKGKS